jgi:hypothetical protein
MTNKVVPFGATFYKMTMPEWFGWLTNLNAA